MSKIFLFIFVGLLVFSTQSCSDDSLSAIQPELSDTEYFQKNISLFDARVRSLDKTMYVREVYFLNLGSDLNRMPSEINFQEVVFFDDGKGNDLVKNDGIYTSFQSFNYDARISYDEKELLKSVLEKPIVSIDFTQSTELHEKVKSYSLRQGQLQSRILEVTCPVKFGTKGCRAERWGWCDSCCVTVDIDNCTVTVGF